MVWSKLLTFDAPAFFDGRTIGHPFQAIRVVRAVAGERVFFPIMIEAHMAHFRVYEAMQQAAIDHRSSANAGANGQVDEGIEPLCDPPFTF